jgi:hypothetical protein
MSWKFFLCLLLVFWGAPFSYGAEKAAPSPLTIVQTQTGNLFLEGRPVAFKIETAAKEAAWRVEDFWGKAILAGVVPIKNGTGDLILPLKARGYFVLKLSVGKFSRETSLAVFSPFDLNAVKDSPFGMNTHFAQGNPPEVMDVVAMGGIKTIRDELYWATVEPKKGEYIFNAYWYMDYARKAGVKPLVPLTYNNRFYDDGLTPYTKAGLAGWAGYAGAVVKNYGEFLEWVEVYNEYNVGFCKGPAASKPENYLEMLKTTYKAVKAVRPGTKVVGPAMACLIWDWLEKLLKLGALEYMDALSVHPYRWDRWNAQGPETLDEDMVRLHALIKKYNKTGRPMPVWSTEVSWPSMPKWEISPEKQADYIVRTYAVLISRGVEKNYWYKFVCDLDDGIESEFGIVRHWDDPRGKLTPKPAYVALAVMARQLTGWMFVERDKIDPAVWSLRFKKGNETLRILWATRPTGVTVGTDQPLTVTDMMGNDETLQPANGEFYLTLSGTPVYLKGPVESLRPGAKIFIITRQKIATGDPIELKCSIDPAISGVLEIEGTSYPIDGKAGLKVLSLPCDSAPKTRTLLYRLKVEGRVVGKGSLTVQIVKPLELKSAMLKKKDLLEFAFVNHSVARELVLDSADWELAGKKGTLTPNLTIKPASTRTLEFSIPELTPFQITPAKVHFKFNDHSSFDFIRDLSFSPCVKRTDPDDLKSLPIDLGKVGTVKIKEYRGKEDLSGRVRIGWDEQNFYLTAKIDDDRFYQEYPREEIWNGDGIQFGLAADNDNRYEFGLALTEKGVRVDCTLSPVATNTDALIAQSKFSVTRSENTLVYQCAIPWNRLPPIKPQNGSFLFSFLVNDNDGAGRKGWIEWAAGIGEGKNLDLYQACGFVEN